MKRMLFGRYHNSWLIINMQCMVSILVFDSSLALGLLNIYMRNLEFYPINVRHANLGMFINGFPKLLRLQTHHEKVLKKFLPRLKKHLDKNGIDTGLYTLKWFFQCFLDRVSSSFVNLIT